LRLRATYGKLLNVLVGDALYSNGPFLSVAKQSGFGVIAVLKKDNNEPLKEALELWGTHPPDSIVRDDSKGEWTELWDVKGLQTLMSYDGPIRVVRIKVHKTKPKGRVRRTGRPAHVPRLTIRPSTTDFSRQRSQVFTIQTPALPRY
jgi:hypothetical protein